MGEVIKSGNSSYNGGNIEVITLQIIIYTSLIMYVRVHTIST